MFTNILNSGGPGQSGDVIPMFSVSDEEESMKNEQYEAVLPLIALKNTVLFPGLVIPITIGRDRSLSALKTAEDGSKFLAVVSQKDLDVEEPGIEDLYEVGTVAKVLKVLKMPDGSTTAILQGRRKYGIRIFCFYEHINAVANQSKGYGPQRD